MGWIPLHVHSQYSILNSTASISGLINKAKEFSLPALALTDEGNMYGAIEFYKGCLQAGIKPIIGCQLHLSPQSRFDKKRIPGSPAGFPLILLAKNIEGYRNLCKLSSLAHLEGFYYTPRIDKSLLEKYAEGLICLSGAIQGLIPFLILQNKEQELEREIEWFHHLFKDDYYLEIQRHSMSETDIQLDKLEKESWLLQNYRDYVRNQEVVLKKLKEIGNKKEIRCVVTNGVHYLERNDWKAHEILMNIQSGEPCEIWERDSQGIPKFRILNPKREVYFSHELYFKSPQQIQDLFSDCLEAVEMTYEISHKIDLVLDFKARYYPIFHPPDSYTKEEYLKELCLKGIKKRYTKERLQKVQEKYPGKNPDEVVQQRLDYELDIILSKGMGDYILIVHDFIAWAKSRGIPVGPGRGSGVGSIILFLIEITDIEPLQFNLFFERFINPERISYPDIDVDICMDRRDELIEYTVQKYGKDKVAQIITFGTMKAKMGIRDVGRILSIPLSKVNEIAKLVPEDLGITLTKALEIDADLRKAYETDSEVQELIDIARKLEGCVRNTGIHAAGLIISGDSLLERIPVCVSKDSDILVTQFSMKPVEMAGMLKIDFLGLKTLTSIQKAVQAIDVRYQIKLDWINLPLDNIPTFNLMHQGKLSGIFQLESPGMQELARQLHIDKFEEIIAVISLYRPGPMDMIPLFTQRKHGKEPIESDHPLMETILAETYGIMVYQEQVMQIASLLANYSLGEGDVLRRAIGKKDKNEMTKQREKFQNGMSQNGIDSDTAVRIFNKIEKFASYGFNKSHATAYAYLSYITAFLKANYPDEWIASLMTCDRDDVTKVAKLINEAQTMEISVLPPDINESGKEFVATPKGIRFAMGAIKGVGEGVVQSIIEERNQNGHFRSLFDFCSRIDTKKVGKKALEHLIEAGCFDFTTDNRRVLILGLEEMYQAAVQKQKERTKGFIDMFTQLTEEEVIPVIQSNEKMISRQEMLKREKELLGFYVTGHPLDEFKDLMQRLSCVPLDQLDQFDANTLIRATFIIDEIYIRISGKTQKKFAVLKVGNGHQRYEIVVWSELFEEKSHLLSENQLIYAILYLDKKDNEIRLQCKWLEDLAKVDEAMIQALDHIFDQMKLQQKMLAKRDRKISQKALKDEPLNKIFIQLNIDLLTLGQILKLKKILRSFKGSHPATIEFFSLSKKLGSLLIDQRWNIAWNSEIENQLQRLPFFLKLKIHSI